MTTTATFKAFVKEKSEQFAFGWDSGSAVTTISLNKDLTKAVSGTYAPLHGGYIGSDECDSIGMFQKDGVISVDSRIFTVSIDEWNIFLKSIGLSEVRKETPLTKEQVIQIHSFLISYRGDF